MKIGYNTNGFMSHRLEDAIAILAELGYQSVAVTLDHYCLNPYDPVCSVQCTHIKRLMDRYDLDRVVETGARFLLDPWRKHQPTLISPTREERSRRIEFLRRSLEVADRIGAGALSFWSGRAADDADRHVLLDRLAAGIEALLPDAERAGIKLAFEPEPGMFVQLMEDFDRLRSRVDHPLLGLTLDIGHLHCVETEAIPSILRRYGQPLFNVHIEDMAVGKHEHLMFGEGTLNFPPIIDTLADLNYHKGLHVELPRHGHDAVETARRAFAFLSEMMAGRNRKGVS